MSAIGAAEKGMVWKVSGKLPAGQIMHDSIGIVNEKIECCGTDIVIGNASMYTETFQNSSVMLKSQKALLFMAQKCP